MLILAEEAKRLLKSAVVSIDGNVNCKNLPMVWLLLAVCLEHHTEGPGSEISNVLFFTCLPFVAQLHSSNQGQSDVLL